MNAHAVLFKLLVIVAMLVSTLPASAANVPATNAAAVSLAPVDRPQNTSTIQESSDQPRLLLRSGAFDPAAGEPAVPSALRRTLSAGQAGLRLIQFPGPIRDEWYQDMLKAGLQVVTYIPDYAYLVWGNATSVKSLEANAPVRWAGLYYPFYALHPDLVDSNKLPAEVEVIVQVYDHVGADETVQAILGQAKQVLRAPQQVLTYRNLGVRIASSELTWLASLPDVVDVEPRPQYQKLDEVQGQIMAGNLNTAGTQPSGPGYLAWLDSHGFPTTADSYPIVDVTDDGIDDGTATPRHPDFYTLGLTNTVDRLIYNANWTTNPAADGLDGHGNLNASIVAAYNDKTGFPYEDGNGFNYGLGINPYGRVAGSKVFCNGGSWCLSGDNYTGLISNTYALGGRISSNSWGANTGGAYTSDDQAYDALVRDAQPGTGAYAGNQEVAIVFSAGNSGSGSNTTGSPGNAKNVITVGAAENYRPTWTDGCGVGPTGADNAQDIISFSSRGPTDDQRVKPDIVAPGTHIEGAASQDPGYNGSGVCDQYMPAGQTLYAASSGTSHSAPAIAGAASLVYYYYQNRFGSPPSPAMTKAYLINATRYLTGTSASGNLPSNSQGYGEIYLEQAFNNANRMLVDQSHVLADSGQVYETQGVIPDAGQPFRVTLAWTDTPGPTTGNAYVNNLDLEVIVNGQTYKGNVFSGATSTTGGTADPRDNVESVFLPAGTTGYFKVRVVATNIAGDGVPGNVDPTDQDFALVIYNGLQESGAITGMVTASGSGDPIVGAKLIASKDVTNTFSVFSDMGGVYTMVVPTGTYDLKAYAYGYLSAQRNGVTVTLNATNTQNFALTAAPNYVVSGVVTDSMTGVPLGATINVNGDPFNPPTISVQTNPTTGYYSLTVAGGQPYTLTASALLHTTQVRSLGEPASNRTENFALVATTTNGGIVGWVRNYYTSEPIANALVTVQAAGMPSDMTDNQGYFEILGLIPGVYTATATAPLYSPVTINNIQVAQSNLAIVTFSLPTSHISYAPPALQKTLTLGTVVTDPAGLVITNTGLGSLTYELVEWPGGFAPALLQHLDSGGPDPYGYIWRTSAEAGGPTYAWIDATGGTALGLDDDGEANITSPFAFPFYGSTSTALRVGNNGGVLYTATAGDLSAGNYTISDTVSTPNNLIAPFWDDIDSDTGNVYWMVTGSAPNRQLVIEWYNRPHYSNIGSATFEVVLFEDGDILYQYLDTNFGNASYDYGASATIGIRGANVANSLQYSYNTASLQDNLAICFDNPTSPSQCGSGGGGGALPWLSESPITGTLSGGATTTQNVQLVWDASVAQVNQPGIYTGSLQIKNNDPLAQNTFVPATMNVLPSAAQGKLMGTVYTSGYCDASTQPISATVRIDGGGGYSKTLRADAAGVYSWWLETSHNPYTVTASYPENITATQAVNITAGVTTTQNLTLRWLKPCVGTNPSSLSVTLAKGLSTTLPLTLSNVGAASLSFELRENPGGFVPLKVQAGEDVLVVQHDTTAASAMQAALTANGYTYLGVTDTQFQAMTVAQLLTYKAVFHAGTTGTSSTPGASEILLMAYLDAGGSLYISDNDLGYWRGGSTFYGTYLQATYVSDDPGIDTLIGQDLMTGLTLSISGDPYPDDFTVGAQGTRIFQYQGGNAAGVKVARNAYEAVYTSFDFQYGGTVADRTEVVRRILQFFTPDVTWLSESPITGTVAASGNQPVAVTFDSSVPEVTQPGLYTATLAVRSNDPFNSSRNIPVAMNVTAPNTWGKLMGIVSSTGYCDVNPAPITGATVFIQGSAGYTQSLVTNSSGSYSWWLDPAQNPYSVTVSYTDQPTTTVSISVTSSLTTTQNFTLRYQKPCVGVNPTSLSASLTLGAQASQPLTLTNSGALTTPFELVEVPGGFTPSQLAARLTARRPVELSVSSIKTGHTPTVPWKAAGPVSLVLDDGSMEDSIGVNGGSVAYQFIWLNRFTPAPADFPFQLDQISMIWPSGQVVAGDAIELVVYADTDGDGNPSNATYLGSYNVTVQTADGVTWNNYTLASPVTLYGPGDVLIGAIDRFVTSSVTTANYPAAFDTTASQGRSWVGWWTADPPAPPVLPPDSTFDTVDNLGLPGNFMIRGSGHTGGGGGGVVPWLDESPISGTLSANAGLAPIVVTFNASAVSQPGQYWATLQVRTDDPLHAHYSIPVTMTVSVPQSYGKLQGTVTGLLRCDLPGAPLSDASILAQNSAGITWTATSNISGTYGLWLSQGTYTMTVSKLGYVMSVPSVVNVTGQMTTTHNVDLRLSAPCASVTPAELTSTQRSGVQMTKTLTVNNTGAVSATWSVTESLPWLSALPVSGTVGGDSSSAVIVTFDSTGLPSNVYTGSLTVNTTDPGLPVFSTPVTMTVQNPPVCSFTSSSPDDLGQITAFTNTTSGDAPITHRWSFGDGSSISAAIHPTHTYAHVGLYTTVLTATNSVGVDVCANPVSIEGVEASFVSNSPVVRGMPVVFTNTTQANPGVSAWVWDLGDSTSSTAQTPPPHTYTSAGLYTVTLTAINIKGSSTFTGTVSVIVQMNYVYLPLIRR